MATEPEAAPPPAAVTETHPDVPGRVPDASRAMIRRTLAAAGIGTFIEFYDFVVYSYLAATIGKLFFPASSDVGSLLAAFAAFGVAFFFRPIGALVFGHIGDRVGRRTALATVVLMMSAFTVLLGLVPTYQTIGIAAPVLLVLIRCAQGFSAGGELSGAATFVIETGPPERRGTYTGLIGATAVAGSLGGAVTVLVMTTLVSATAVDAWAWRVPFLLAGVLGVIGLYIRMRLEDTPVFRRMQSTTRPEQRARLGELVRSSPRALTVLVGVAGAHSIGVYFLYTFMISFLHQTVGWSLQDTLVSNSVALVVGIAAAVLASRCSDRVGRKPLLLAGFAAYVVLAIPCYLMTGSDSLVVVTLCQCGLAIVAGTTSALVTIVQVELFPPRFRYSASGIGFNVAQVIGGGTAPFVATALISATATNLAAFLYLLVVGLVGLVIVATLLPETVHADIAADSASRGTS